MLFEMSDNMQTQQFEREQLLDVFTEMGWWSIERAQFVALSSGGRRLLRLADQHEEADEQFRYFHAQFRYADTGETLTPPLVLDLRWLVNA